MEDVITVTAESPLLDERRISTGCTVSQTELEKIPTARDSYAVLQTTPGVLTDRVNVGGNESGQQSAYVGPGNGADQAVWSADGSVITDMAALGSSPAYYDFDAFEEMRVTIPEAEVKGLCAEIQRAGWTGITLERALAAGAFPERSSPEGVRCRPAARFPRRDAPGQGVLRAARRRCSPRPGRTSIASSGRKADTIDSGA